MAADFVTAGAAPDPGSAAPLLLLLHGYGSDERDLLPIAERLGLPGLGVRAPIAMSWGGNAWAELGPDQADLPAAAPYRAVAAELLDWLDAAVGAARPVIPLGFSQGGLMVSELLRAAPARFPAAVICSGFIAGEPGEHDDALHDVPVFTGHGTEDRRIPQPWVEATSAWLAAHVALTERTYPGLGHGIAPAEIADIAAFLDPLR